MSFIKNQQKTPFQNALEKLNIGELKPGNKIEILEDIYVYWPNGYSERFNKKNKTILLRKKDIKPEYRKIDMMLTMPKNSIFIIGDNNNLIVIDDLDRKYAEKFINFIKLNKLYKTLDY